MNNLVIPINQELAEKINQFRIDWYQFYKTISNETTPEVDGTGQKIIRRRPDGYNYIIEAWMRNQLDKYFPGWSWEMSAMPHFLGAEWVVVYGTLTIIDSHLLILGIQPPTRKFSTANATRIKFKQNQPHTPENIIDIGNDVTGANSKALKKAINQLTHIGDDIYNKRIEDEGSGTYESLMESNPDIDRFSQWVTAHKGLWSDIYAILKVKDISEITDWKLAYETVKAKKGW